MFQFFQSIPSPVRFLIGLALVAIILDFCFWLWEKHRWDFPAAGGVVALMAGVFVFSINPRVDKEHMVIYALWVLASLLIFIPSAMNADREAELKEKLR